MSDTSEKSKAEFHTDMPVGEILRRGREHFGQSLEDVERNLRIRAIQLHALETGNIDQLPGKAYALGFVRSYSEYLGLDGEKMVQLFKRQSLGAKIQPNLHFPTPASESKLPGVFIAIIFAVFGIIAIWAWMAYSNDDRAIVANVPDVSEVQADNAAVVPQDNSSSAVAAATNSSNIVNAAISTQSQTTSGNVVSATTASDQANIEPSAANGNEATTSPADVVQGQQVPALDSSSALENSAAPATATASGAEVQTSESAVSPEAEQQKGIILNVKENSWVEIRDTSGQALVSRVLKAGDQYYVPDRPDLRMSLGNASGVEIVIDGVALPFLGARGEVKRNISLDSKSLKALAGR